jgi:hypothetical protein
MKKASRPATAEKPSPTGRTVDDLIAEQGVNPLARFEDLFGAGQDLWTDEEFRTFLEQLRTTREETE